MREVAENENPADRHNGPVGRPALSEPEHVFLGVLVLLGERKNFIALITSIFGAAALCISLLLPNQYEAVTTLLPPQQPNSSSALMAQLGNLGALGSMTGAVSIKNPVDMYVSLLKSRTVEDAMIQRFNLMDRFKVKRMVDARKVINKAFVIESGPKDGLIRITIKDRDPKMAAALANGYVEEYQKFSAGLAVTEASQRRIFFEREMQKSKNDLASDEEALKQIEQVSGVIQLDSQSRALVESVASLTAQISAKEVQIRADSTAKTDSNPDVQLAREQLAAMQDQLRKLGGSSALLVQRSKVSDASMEYLRKLRDVKYDETIFDLLAKQFEAAKIDEAREGAIVQVVDAAVVPDRKASPRRALITIGGAFLGSILAMFIVLLKKSLMNLDASSEGRAMLNALRKAWRSSLVRDHSSMPTAKI